MSSSLTIVGAAPLAAAGVTETTPNYRYNRISNILKHGLLGSDKIDPTESSHTSSADGDGNKIVFVNHVNSAEGSSEVLHAQFIGAFPVSLERQNDLSMIDALIPSIAEELDAYIEKEKQRIIPPETPESIVSMLQRTIEKSRNVYAVNMLSKIEPLRSILTNRVHGVALFILSPSSAALASDFPCASRDDDLEQVPSEEIQAILMSKRLQDDSNLQKIISENPRIQVADDIAAHEMLENRIPLIFVDEESQDIIYSWNTTEGKQKVKINLKAPSFQSILESFFDHFGSYRTHVTRLVE